MPKPPVRTLDPTILVDDIALDDEHVIVVTSYDDTKLFVVRHDGTERRDLVRGDGSGYSRVVADAAGIFAASASGLERIDKLTAARTELVLSPGRIWGLALDAEDVYASVLGTYPRHADGGVMRVSRRGGDVEWLVRGRSVGALAVAGGRLYFASGSTLYVRDQDGEIRALAPAANPHTIVILGEAIAWTEFDNAGRPRCLIGGGPPRTLAIQSYTSDMIAIGPWLYWTQSSSKKRTPAIWRMRLDDAEPEPLASFSGKAPRLAGNSRLLCWVGNNNGGVHAMPTPG